MIRDPQSTPPWSRPGVTDRLTAATVVFALLGLASLGDGGAVGKRLVVRDGAPLARVGWTLRLLFSLQRIRSPGRLTERSSGEISIEHVVSRRRSALLALFVEIAAVARFFVETLWTLGRAIDEERQSVCNPGIEDRFNCSCFLLVFSDIEDVPQEPLDDTRVFEE